MDKTQRVPQAVLDKAEAEAEAEAEQSRTYVYRVSEIFASIQGEGRQTGKPMVFVRLQGCSVRCSWCDTRVAWSTDPADAPSLMTAQQITDEVHGLVGIYPGIDWVCITGGEPLEQDLRPLLRLLRPSDAWGRMFVAIETSLADPGGSDMLSFARDILEPRPWQQYERCNFLTVSPKVHMPPLTHLLKHADELKVPIAHASDLALAAHWRDFCAPAICRASLQPVWLPSEARPSTLDLCVSYAQAHGWDLSFQTHKCFGLR